MVDDHLESDRESQVNKADSLGVHIYKCSYFARAFFSIIIIFTSVFLNPNKAYAVAAWDLTVNRLTPIPVPSGTAVNYELQVQCSAVAEPSCNNGQITLDIPDDIRDLLGIAVGLPNPVIDSVTTTPTGAVINLIDVYPAGATASILFSITPPNGLTPDGYTWTVDATLTGDNTPGTETDSTDGSSTADAQLGIVKWGPLGTADGRDVPLGETVRYQLVPCDPTLNGTGDLFLETATLTDILPPEATFVAASPGGVFTPDPTDPTGTTGGTVTWDNLTNLNLGNCSINFSPFWIEVSYPEPPATTMLSVTNETTISGTFVGETDARTATDTINHSFVDSNPQGSFQKENFSSADPTSRDTNTEAFAGVPHAYWHLRVTNPGNVAITYELVDPIPCLDNVTGNPPLYNSNDPGDICMNPAYITQSLSVPFSVVSLQARQAGYRPTYITNMGTTGFFEWVSSSLWEPAGVPDGEIIAEITFPEHPLVQIAPPSPIIRSHLVTIRGFVAANDPAGTMPAGAQVINTATATYFAGGSEQGSGEELASFRIIENEVIGAAFKSISDIATTGLPRFVRLTAEQNSATPQSITMTDLLPPGMTYDVLRAACVLPTNSPTTNCATRELDRFNVEIIPNYMGTGRELIRLTSIPGQDILPGEKVFFNFDVNSAGMAPGTYVNNLQVFFGEDIEFCRQGVTKPAALTGDPLDLDGDGDFNDAYCQASANAIIDPQANFLSSQKRVRGDLDTDFQGFPGVGSVSQAATGTAVYELSFTNNGTQPLTNPVLYDILPHENDTGVSSTQVGTMRNSDMDVRLASLLSGALPAGAIVEYSDSSNPCRDEVGDGSLPWPAGCTNDWTASPDVVTDVRAFRIIQDPAPGADAFVLSAGQNVTMTFSVNVTPFASDADGQLTPGEIGWNSFAIVADGLLATEPPKVGLAVPLSDISVEKTVNGGESATVGIGEEFTFEIVVRHDATIVENPDGSVSYVDRETNLPTSAVSPATNVTLGDIVPAGMTIVSASPAGAYDLTTQTWTVGDIYPDQSFTLLLTATVDSVGSFTNGVHVTRNNTEDVDSQPDNWSGPPDSPVQDDEDTALVEAVVPAIELIKFVEDSRDSGDYIDANQGTTEIGNYSVGEPIRYRFVVTNPTALTLTDVVVTDPLIAGFCDPATLQVASLAPNGSVTFDCEFPLGFSDTSGPIVNTATVTGNYNDTILTDDDTAQVQVTLPLWDMSDAPDDYQTELATDGPRHVIGDDLILGNVTPDSDTNGVPSARADGDDNSGDDEDGWSPPTSITVDSGDTYTTIVSVTNNTGADAYLSGWIDFDGNGVFDDDERATVRVPAGATSVTLNFTVPADTPVSTDQDTYARFRISSDPTAVASPSGAAPDGEVEDYALVSTTTPITLGYFHAQQGVNPGEITIRWQTVTESGNVGFNLYGKVKGEPWQRMNSELILSSVGDALTVQRYEFLSLGPVVTRFAIGDLDIFGKETLHGPFRLNKEHGVNRADRKRTDWTNIRQQSEAKKVTRKAKREAKRAKRLQRMERKLDREERQMRRQLKRQQRLEKKALKQNGRSQSSDVPRSGWPSRLLGALLLGLVPSAHASEVIEPVVDPGLIYLQTEEPGIYRVTYEQLLAEGIDLAGVKHKHLGLTRHGEKVGVRSKGQDKAHGKTRFFGPGGWLEFVADAEQTLYSKKSMYALYHDKSKRKTIAVDKRKPNYTSAAYITQYQATVTNELDLRYYPYSSSGDPWYATRLASTSVPVTHPLPIEVDYIMPGAVEAGAVVWGGYAGTHTVSVQLNDYALGSRVFEGFSSETIGGLTSASALVEGTNYVKVTASNQPGQQVDIVHTDHWYVTYPRELITEKDELIFTANGARFEVAGFSSKPSGNANRRVYRRSSEGELVWMNRVWMPTYADGSYGLRIAGDAADTATYYVALSTALKQVEFVEPVEQDDMLTGEADYLVISHADFMDSTMDALISARQGQGYRTKVVDVEAVYSAFDHGYFGAQAIRSYIAWAHEHLGVEMVLLVGGDTNDYHGNLNSGSMSFVPSLYTQTSHHLFFAPSDAKYTDIDDDDMPDLAIGRLIPRTTQEWANIVAKTLQYPSHPYPRSMVFAVDKHDTVAGYSFSADADDTIDNLPAAWQQDITRAYIDELGTAVARNTLINALNEGQAVASMFGHSGSRDWTFEGLFRAGDAANLINAGAPTIITQWGCWNTYYVHNREDTLAHEFMLNDLNGAAAVLGASTLTEAAHEREMAKQVYPRMFESGKPIGQAILEAKKAHAQLSPDELDVILGWNLLGDPALEVEGG